MINALIAVGHYENAQEAVIRDFQEINYPNKRTTPDAENTERGEIERVLAHYYDYPTRS